MRLLLVSATEFELAGVAKAFDLLPNQTDSLSIGENQVYWLVAGVGIANTAFNLGSHLATHEYDLIIQAGIGGAIDNQMEIGKVYEVIADCFGNFGAEHPDGRIESVFEMGLIEAGNLYDEKGFLQNPRPLLANLKNAIGVTVQTVHGSQESIDKLVKSHPTCTIESMEGAAFFMACLQRKQACVQLRAISNYVEPRNKAAWEIQAALKSLNQVVLDYIKSIF